MAAQLPLVELFWQLFAHSSHGLSIFRPFFPNLKNLETQNEVLGSKLLWLRLTQSVSKSFCISQIPHNSVNLSFAITSIKNWLTELCGNCLLQNEFKDTLSEIRLNAADPRVRNSTPARTRSARGTTAPTPTVAPTPRRAQASAPYRERIFVELMTSDRTLKASTEGSNEGSTGPTQGYLAHKKLSTP